MLTSLNWLNHYLEPPLPGADDAEHVLTHVGFPIESREELPHSAMGSISGCGGASGVGSGSRGDIRLDVELTSNRGDCLCHLGLAREIAAATGRKLILPDCSAPASSSSAISSLTSVDNQLASVSGGGGGMASPCPRFTARLIRGVRIGPSPAWLVGALESIGQRSINNVVDVTNFILHELGHPSHVFDFNTLAGKRLVVRYARPNEPFTALDGRKHSLRPDDMVVADADRAVSLAGVIGGLDTGVTERTTDVLLEVATWDPLAVRRAARRLDIRTDASHRFERYVDARDLEIASARAARLILEVAGGELLDGMIDAGTSPAPRTVIFMRSDRCNQILGVKVATADMVRLLHSIGIEVSVERHGHEERLKCLVPHHRHDLSREVDLIEEIARLNGFDKIHVAPTLDVHLELAHPTAWPQREKAMAEIGRVLTGAGFFETVTFSFVTQRDAELFLPPGLRLLKIDEDRRKEAPYLRPSLVPSLLTCRRANQDGQVRQPGGVRLFEFASVFAEDDDGPSFGRRTRQQMHLGLLMDLPTEAPVRESKQAAVRAMHGLIEHLAGALGGGRARVRFEAAPPIMPAIDPEAAARIILNDSPAGYLSCASRGALQHYGLETGVCFAEVCLGMLIDLYPPAHRVVPLPAFPSIDRDLSLVVSETVSWTMCEAAVREAAPTHCLEAIDFIGTYRGKPLDAGKKSITLRFRFRDSQRTLRNEELDEPMAQIMTSARAKLGALVRGVDIA